MSMPFLERAKNSRSAICFMIAKRPPKNRGLIMLMLGGPGGT